jgi:muramidase (phage lysozyme)
MTETVTSPTGKILRHVATMTTTPQSNNAVKEVRIKVKNKRLEENKEYLKNKNVKAFIASIAAAEGGDYNLKYGGVKGKKNDKWQFSDFSTHPGAGSDGKTTAAGMYQINHATWKEMSAKMDLSDFSPGTQDLLAVEILRTIGVIDTIVGGDISTGLSAASRRWAALPEGSGKTGRYAPQPYMKYEDFEASYKNNGGSLK